VLEDNIHPQAYVEENQLGMVGDSGQIEAAVAAVLAENQKSVAEFKGGSQKVLGFLIGQTMKKLGGKADPQMVGEVLSRQLAQE